MSDPDPRRRFESLRLESVGYQGNVAARDRVLALYSIAIELRRLNETLDKKFLDKLDGTCNQIGT